MVTAWVMFLAPGGQADDTARASRSPTTASSLSVPSATSAEVEQALSRFRAFTGTWMDKLRGESALRTVAASSGARDLKRFSAEYSEEVKQTGSTSNPYVGILHYTEEFYRCTGPAEETCTMVESTPVTEIFRYQRGAWVY
jgi:hypothetical protein